MHDSSSSMRARQGSRQGNGWAGSACCAAPAQEAHQAASSRAHQQLFRIHGGIIQGPARSSSQLPCCGHAHRHGRSPQPQHKPRPVVLAVHIRQPDPELSRCGSCCYLQEKPAAPFTCHQPRHHVAPVVHRLRKSGKRRRHREDDSLGPKVRACCN